MNMNNNISATIYDIYGKDTSPIGQYKEGTEIGAFGFMFECFKEKPSKYVMVLSGFSKPGYKKLVIRKDGSIYCLTSF